MKTRKMTDRMLLESLLNKYGVKKITNVINKMNENQDNIQVLYNSLPEADDDYRDAYEEDVEVGDVDPEEEDYYEYLSRMRDMETEDLEDNINIADGKYGYYYTICKNPDDNSVSNDLWDAIYALVQSEYCKISFVNDHIEVEVAHYNSQNRSYYKIYALNQKGCDLYEDDEDVYYGHDMAKLNNPKYFRRMEPIM